MFLSPPAGREKMICRSWPDGARETFLPFSFALQESDRYYLHVLVSVDTQGVLGL